MNRTRFRSPRAVLHVIAVTTFMVGLASCGGLTSLTGGVEFIIENDAYTSVDVNLLAPHSDSRIIPAGGDAMWTFRSPPGQVTFRASGYSRTVSGTPVGEVVEWEATTHINESRLVVATLKVGPELFFLQVENNGPHRLVNFKVFEHSGAVRDLGVTVPADGEVYGIGYHRLANKIQARYEGTSTILEWTGFHFPHEFGLLQRIATEDAKLMSD